MTVMVVHISRETDLETRPSSKLNGDTFSQSHLCSLGAEVKVIRHGSKECQWWDVLPDFRNLTLKLAKRAELIFIDLDLLHDFEKDFAEHLDRVRIMEDYTIEKLYQQISSLELDDRLLA